MSLFPAYASNSEQTNPKEDTTDWLNNSSYKLNVASNESTTSNVENKPSSSDSSTESEKDVQVINSGSRSKKQKLKRSHDEPREVYKVVKYTDDFTKNLVGDFGVDKKPQRIYLSINTISRPAIPKYKTSRYKIYNKFKKRPLKKERYYYKMKKLMRDKNVDRIDKQLENEEEHIKQKTSYYNQELGRNPFDVNIWLEYIKFQDIVWEFEKTYRKGSIAKGIRATAERKLAIIDKALTHNPRNVALARERLKTCETVYPNDELSSYLRKFVDKEPDNIILWQGFIESTQCSMAHCNTSAVIALYNECLGKLHQQRRTSQLEKSLLEEKILTILYQCSLFLRQAGLWEQLWTLLRLYLVLNLSQHDKNKFSITSNVNESHLLELEEVILESKLPSHELWLRMEKLRESYHWLPWSGQKNCDDPQRTVFVEDISDLIHPITSDDNIFKLTVMILNLLKVPLLPFRHTTLQKLGLDYVPWSLDSIETILPIFYPQLLINKNITFLEDIGQFSVGPQYLKTHPGQEEYLEFLVNVIKRCGDCLENEERTAIFIWWLRFEKLLIYLDKYNKFKMPSGRLKKVKSDIKNFLKLPENRNNVLFYCEYALIEFELNNFEVSFNILLTAISMLTENKIVSLLDKETRTNLCYLYRNLVELHIRHSNFDAKQVLIKYLTSMVINVEINEQNFENVISEAINKYEEITNEYFDLETNILSLPSHFLPDFVTDWVICHALLVFLVRSTFEAGIVIERVLTRLEENRSDAWRREVLMEWYISMLYKTCVDNVGFGLFKLFRDTLNRSLKLFPNNLYMLTVASLEQSMSGCLTQSWWKLSNILSSQGHAIPAIFLIFVTNNLLSKRTEQWKSQDNTDPILAVSSIKNRMISVFRKLTTGSMCTKRCGLVWRLYLQFLYNYCDPEMLRKAYFSAVEECPWLKALYIDAAIYIPAELSQIQDLIIEKELRIHVAPEELEILKT